MRSYCLFLPLILPVLMISGCGKSDQELLEEAQTENQALQNQLHQTQQKLLAAQLTLSTLQSHTSELTAAFDRLHDEDWRNVIPDLYNHSKTIAADASDLESELDDAVMAAQ